MGYILVLILGLVVVFVLVAAFMGGKRGGAGRARPHNDMTPKTPSADAPNPGASSTASAGEAGAAQRHTPPA